MITPHTHFLFLFFLIFYYVLFVDFDFIFCSESQLQQFLEETVEANACILDASLFKVENLVKLHFHLLFLKCIWDFF